MGQATLARPPEIPAVPTDVPSIRVVVVRFAQAINRILRGGLGCTLIVTLVPNDVSSTFSDSRIGPFTSINLVPVTVHAADILPSLYMVCGQGNVTIHHGNITY